jgi:hypothetical protein
MRRLIYTDNQLDIWDFGNDTYLFHDEAKQGQDHCRLVPSDEVAEYLTREYPHLRLDLAR